MRHFLLITVDYFIFFSETAGESGRASRFLASFPALLGQFSPKFKGYCLDKLASPLKINIAVSYWVN